ncbi:unnamed protein product [Ectocarpus sp. 6 AP-2014]
MTPVYYKSTERFAVHKQRVSASPGPCWRKAERFGRGKWGETFLRSLRGLGLATFRFFLLAGILSE